MIIDDIIKYTSLVQDKPVLNISVRKDVERKQTFQLIFEYLNKYYNSLECKKDIFKNNIGIEPEGIRIEPLEKEFNFARRGYSITGQYPKKCRVA